MIKKKSFWVPLYGARVHILTAATATEAVSYFKPNVAMVKDLDNDPHYYAYWHAFTASWDKPSKDGTPASDFCIYVPNKGCDHNTMFHEVGHLTFKILKWAGSAARDEEAFCYLQGWIGDKVTRELLKMHIKIV